MFLPAIERAFGGFLYFKTDHVYSNLATKKSNISTYVEKRFYTYLNNIPF